MVVYNCINNIYKFYLTFLHSLIIEKKGEDFQMIIQTDNLQVSLFYSIGTHYVILPTSPHHTTLK